MKKLFVLPLVAMSIFSVASASDVTSTQRPIQQLLNQALVLPDYASVRNAFAKLCDQYPNEAATLLPYKFALEIKFGDQGEATRTLEGILVRARASKNPGELVEAVYQGIRQSVPPACGATPFAALKYLAAEFGRLHSSFVPLLNRAADASLELAPDSDICLTAKAEAAFLAGDLKLSAACTRKTLAGITNPAAHKNTLRYLAELEGAVKAAR